MAIYCGYHLYLLLPTYSGKTDFLSLNQETCSPSNNLCTFLASFSLCSLLIGSSTSQSPFYLLFCHCQFFCYLFRSLVTACPTPPLSKLTPFSLPCLSQAFLPFLLLSNFSLGHFLVTTSTDMQNVLCCCVQITMRNTRMRKARAPVFRESQSSVGERHTLLPALPSPVPPSHPGVHCPPQAIPFTGHQALCHFARLTYFVT